MFTVHDLDDWGVDGDPTREERLADGLGLLADDEPLRGADC